MRRQYNYIITRLKSYRKFAHSRIRSELFCTALKATYQEVPAFPSARPLPALGSRTPHLSHVNVASLTERLCSCLAQRFLTSALTASRGSHASPRPVSRGPCAFPVAPYAPESHLRSRFVRATDSALHNQRTPCDNSRRVHVTSQ